MTFNAKAGKTYSVHWHDVKPPGWLPWKKEVGYLWKEVGYLWIEDDSGSVVAGEKPPAEGGRTGPVDVVGGVGSVSLTGMTPPTSSWPAHVPYVRRSPMPVPRRTRGRVGQ